MKSGSHTRLRRATWSPTACVVERRINRYALRDERQPLNDRMASFEQNNFWLNTHQQLPAGSVPVQRLEAQCETIVKHLRDTSAGRVSVARMELFFKVDAVNRIWLLYCNSLRLDKTVVVVDRSPGGLTRQLSKQYTLRVGEQPTAHSWAPCWGPLHNHDTTNHGMPQSMCASVFYGPKEPLKHSTWHTS